MFILHAEHEMNCSTAAARHLASSGVDVYTAIGGKPDMQQITERTAAVGVALPCQHTHGCSAPQTA